MVTSEHLDYHRDLTEYIEAKRNILRFQTPLDFAVINQDYPASHESDITTKGQVYFVSREREVERGCFVSDNGVWLRFKDREEKVIETKDILLRGKHNLENVCAAVAAASLAGCSIGSIVEVLKTFKGLEHRLEFVSERQGIRFYNDSLATVPEATIEAIEALGDDVETLIAGGHDRGLDYTELGRYISNSKIKTLISFPVTGEKIWEAVCKTVPNENLRPKKYDVSSMKEAIIIAYEQTDPGKICLLSPGAASFNIFKSYRDRGDQFKHFVNSLE